MLYSPFFPDQAESTPIPTESLKLLQLGITKSRPQKIPVRQFFNISLQFTSTVHFYFPFHVWKAVPLKLFGEDLLIPLSTVAIM